MPLHIVLYRNGQEIESGGNSVSQLFNLQQFGDRCAVLKLYYYYYYYILTCFSKEVTITKAWSAAIFTKHQSRTRDY